MGQGDADEKVKGGQNLARMNLIVQRIESELGQLKNLINLQIQGLTTSPSTNYDGNPDSDGNCDTSISIHDDSHSHYINMDIIKIENDQFSTIITTGDSGGVSNYQEEEFNEDQEDQTDTDQNRPSNVEDELILGGMNFNFEVPSTDQVYANPHESFCTVTGPQFKGKSKTNPISNSTSIQKDILQTVKSSSKSRAKGSGKKSKICPTCSRTFRSFTDLSRHSRVHTGERPFNCTICSKTFNRMDTLKNHAMVHTGEKPHFCSFCSKSFRERKNLNDHIRGIHTGESPYPCSVCDQVFSKSKDVRKHERTQHHDLEKITKVTDFESQVQDT